MPQYTIVVTNIILISSLQSSISCPCFTVKNVVYYMALRSANHTVIRVVNTTQCHMIHQLVWYAQFIFTVLMLDTTHKRKAMVITL